MNRLQIQGPDQQLPVQSRIRLQERRTESEENQPIVGDKTRMNACKPFASERQSANHIAARFCPKPVWKSAPFVLAVACVASTAHAQYPRISSEIAAEARA